MAIKLIETSNNMVPLKNIRKHAPLVALGTMGELEMYGLTLPGVGNEDPASVVCLSVDNALRLLLPILERLWKLDRGTQAGLLGVRPSTLALYRRGRSVPRRREQTRRIGSLLRIYAALRVLLPREDDADAWPARPNTRFRPNPVAYMKRRGTKDVEHYLRDTLA